MKEQALISAGNRAMMRTYLRSAAGEGEAFVLGASSRGLRLSMAHPPRRGESVEFLVGWQIIPGTVHWSLGKRCGITLAQPINVLALLEGGDFPIRLSAAAAAQERRGIADAMASDGPLAGRLLQLALVVLALAGVGLTVSHLVHSNADLIEATGDAMAGGGDLSH